MDNVKAASAGDIDFCVTSINYYLLAREQMGEVAARFVGVVFSRSPISAIVTEASGLTEPADLTGRRLGGRSDDGLVVEFFGALEERAVEPPALVPTAYDAAPAALGRGEIDMLADFADLVPRVRRQSGVPVKAVRVGLDHYANGLLAGDHVPDDTATAMSRAVWAALERQRQQPEAGLDELLRRYPEVNPAEALEGWALAQESIFTGGEPGVMSAQRWAATVAYSCRIHGRALVDPQTVYRPELVAAD